MAVTPSSGATDTATPDFPALFREYIVNSVQATLAAMPPGDALLTAEMRDRALHVLSFALKQAVAWPSTRDLLLLLAPKLEQAGYRDDWWPYLEAGVELSQCCGDQLAEAELRLQVGHLRYLCSRFDLAEQQLSTSLTIFHSLANTHGQARTYNELAWLHHLQHRYDEATHNVEQAFALLNDKDPERAMSYRVQGSILNDQWRWEEAEECHRKALALFKKQGDRRGIAASMQNLTRALREQKKFEEVVRYYQEALTMLDNLADSHSLGIVQMNLGTTLCCYLDKPFESLIHYKQAEVIFNRLHDRLNIAKIQTGFGLGYLGIREYTQAQNAFLISIRIFAELEDDSLRLNATDGLVMTYLASKQYHQAAEVAEHALGELFIIANAPSYAYLLQSLNQHLIEARQGQGSNINNL